MLHAYATRFDVIVLDEKFLDLNKALGQSKAGQKDMEMEQ
jgi:hypothetical protein